MRRLAPLDEAAGSKKLKKEMKFKDGTSLPAGTEVSVAFTKDNPGVALITVAGGVLSLYSDRTYRVRSSSLHKYLSGFTKPPSVATMAKWGDDGVAKSVGGERVEPDGWDSDGTPSWMLALSVV